MSARRTAAVAAALRWGARRRPFVEDEVVGPRAFVRPGAVCVDIGAEYGLCTWALSALAGPSGQVHGVEPLPVPSRRLRTAARLLGAHHVTAYRTALGARPGSGVLSLPVRRGLPVHGRAYVTEGAEQPGPNAEFRTPRHVRTPVRILDQLADEAGLEALAFVKADVEGAELAVLRGGTATLWRHRPVLLETEQRHLAKYGGAPAEVLQHLGDLGYRAHHRHHCSWTSAPRVTGDCRNHLFTT
ncbi:FkbM family methyltransferase [Streptomyces niger]|uniref:FkbM family methyltransferase n=1 Tax=Streptomyces niger TaxID=66373 RepID=UPI00069CB1D4|nr:FkbM family methyltransferase [Streptomyces niger]